MDVEPANSGASDKYLEHDPTGLQFGIVDIVLLTTCVAGGFAVFGWLQPEQADQYLGSPYGWFIRALIGLQMGLGAWSILVLADAWRRISFGFHHPGYRLCLLAFWGFSLFSGALVALGLNSYLMMAALALLVFIMQITVLVVFVVGCFQDKWWWQVFFALAVSGLAVGLCLTFLDLIGLYDESLTFAFTVVQWITFAFAVFSLPIAVICDWVNKVPRDRVHYVGVITATICIIIPVLVVFGVILRVA